MQELIALLKILIAALVLAGVVLGLSAATEYQKSHVREYVKPEAREIIARPGGENLNKCHFVRCEDE